MGKHGQLVMGPAGSGKSTYCQVINEHCEVSKRRVHVINLDPAAEDFPYPVAADIRELIRASDAADLLGLGPNGALLFCIDYLAQNVDWLTAILGDYEDDYIVLDCPGNREYYCAN